MKRKTKEENAESVLFLWIKGIERRVFANAKTNETNEIRQFKGDQH